MTLYPLKFKPILKERIWGGTKLKTVLGKDSQLDTVGGFRNDWPQFFLHVLNFNQSTVY